MKRQIILLLIFSVWLSSFGVAQFKVNQGTSMTVEPSTDLYINIPGQNLIIDSSANLTNNGTIYLGDSTDVNEFNLFPINGTGTEKCIRDLNFYTANGNIGGMGLKINLSNVPSSIFLERGHTSLYNIGSDVSINRWFQINMSDSSYSNFDFTFLYDSTELNNNSSANISTIRKTNSLSNWSSLGGLRDAFFVTSTTDSIGAFTLFPSYTEFISLNDTTFCIGDLLSVDFVSHGLFNGGNKFILEFSDSTGSFSNSIYVDTVLVDSLNLEYYFPSNFDADNNYFLRIKTISPEWNSIDTAFSVYSYPNLPVITTSLDTLFSSSAVDNQWYLNNTPLLGETDNFLIIPINGNYQVEVNNHGCSTFSDTITFTNLYLKEESSDSFIKVFPNPVESELLIIDYSNFSDLKRLDVFNCHGQIILSKTISETNLSLKISVDEWKSGIYFLTFQSDTNGIFVTKILKL